MPSPKIVVVGSSNTDMVVQSDHLPAPGETVLGGAFSLHPGGKGANQAVAAARLGGKVTFVTRLGDDLFGNQTIERFKKERIDVSKIVRDSSAPSGIALIMVDAKGENSISVALGANNRLTPADVNAAEDELADAEYVLVQLETPLHVAKHLARRAAEMSYRLILNPAPVRPLTDELLKRLYLITPNAIEAGLLTGMEVTDESSARTAANRLRLRGVPNVVITLGSAGALIVTDDFTELIPTLDVKVVDTTAAGDTFNGALVVALSEGKDLRSAVAFANRAAAYSVGILGAQTSAPTRADID